MTMTLDVAAPWLRGLSGVGGYSADIRDSLLDLEVPSEDSDADALFRSLMLDDGLRVEDARLYYLAALSVIEHKQRKQENG